MKVFVTDAANRVALAVIRALGKCGARVTAAEQESLARRGPAGFYSRYVHRRVVLPDLRDRDRFLKELRGHAETSDVLLPISTNVLLTVARYRESFRNIPARLPIPPYETLTQANRKDSLMELAQKLGIPVPRSYGKEELTQARFPVVIKLRDDDGLYLEPSRRYRIVERPADVSEAWSGMNRLKEHPLIQEYIPGDGYGCSVLMGEREQVLAVFCHRRIRELPVTGGPSTLCESVYDPQLIEMSVRLLRALHWTGVAMVEFKKDRRDGRYRLMEINPRFWGALPLAIRCGVNFPDLLCRYAMGRPVDPVLSYPVGRKMRFLFMDLAAVLSACRTSVPADGGGPRCRAMDYLGGCVRDLFDLTIKDGILDVSDAGAGVKCVINHLI